MSLPMSASTSSTGSPPGNQSGKPFFAYLAFNAPHSPFQIADEWAQPYRDAGVNETHVRLYGMESNIDSNAGRLLATLDKLGIADNTLVVFNSDHGPCGSALDRDGHAGERHRWNAGLRDIKGSMYQGGVQVPSFWHWPGRLRAGRDVDTLSATVDILPTLKELAGADLPDPPSDGVSLGDAPVRYRNYAAITQRWKVTRPHEEAVDELYDLQRDPHETAEIAVAHHDVVEQLRSEYDRWFDDVGATRGGCTFDPQTVHLGLDEENPVLLTQNDWRTLDGLEGWRSDGLRGSCAHAPGCTSRNGISGVG
jgi:arylsulfatase A-like enzyme